MEYHHSANQIMIYSAPLLLTDLRFPRYFPKYLCLNENLAKINKPDLFFPDFFFTDNKSFASRFLTFHR